MNIDSTIINAPIVDVLPEQPKEWDNAISNNQLWIFVNGAWKVLIHDVNTYLEKIKERER